MTPTFPPRLEGCETFSECRAVGGHQLPVADGSVANQEPQMSRSLNSGNCHSRKVAQSLFQRHD